MAFEDIVSMRCETRTQIGGTNKKTGKENPSSVTGFYLGYTQLDSVKSKTGKQNLYIFKTPKGNVGVYGNRDLDDNLPKVQLGYLVRVTFAGMKPTKNNPMYTYRFEIDKSQQIDVADTGSAAPSVSLEEEEASSWSAVDSDEGDDDVAAYSPPPVAAKRAAATVDDAQTAKMNALFNKARKAV